MLDKRSQDVRVCRRALNGRLALFSSKSFFVFLVLVSFVLFPSVYRRRRITSFAGAVYEGLSRKFHCTTRHAVAHDRVSNSDESLLNDQQDDAVLQYSPRGAEWLKQSSSKATFLGFQLLIACLTFSAHLLLPCMSEHLDFNQE